MLFRSLAATLRAELDNARRLQLLRDQWTLRKQAYRDYQRTVGADLLWLAKLQPSLEAIRQLTGPPPEQLATLQSRLQGGADRLQRMTVADDLKPAHDLIVGAWRFAESAVDTRYSAVRSGNVSTAWQASSSAAGALLFIDKAQRELRGLLQPPQLQ